MKGNFHPYTEGRVAGRSWTVGLTSLSFKLHASTQPLTQQLQYGLYFFLADQPSTAKNTLTTECLTE